MVKLSDALRGAADRAPLEGISVDSRHVARRAATQRGLRSGSGGLVGAGMVAVIAAGLAGPGGVVAASGEDSARDVAADGGGAQILGDGAAPEFDGTTLAWGLCGQALPALPAIAGPVMLSSSLASDEAAGDTLEVAVTTAVIATGTFETFGLDGVILWDGVVVGTIDGAPGDGVARELTTVDLIEGDESTTSTGVPLVNCWDGEPLPAAKYELVVSQEYWDTVVVEEPPVEEPPVEEPPVEEPPVEEPPVEEPSVEPVEPTLGGPDDPAASGLAPESPVSADDAVVSTDGTADGASSIAAGGMAVRVVAAAVPFVVPGEPVDDPFGAYLNEPEPEPTDPGDPVAPPIPDGTLDPATARELYRAGLTGAWDMAPGTQRWIATWDSMDEGTYRWYGCPYEGAGTFPDRSAVMDILRVQVEAPGAIDISYGWVVEDNPRVTTTLTNASEWDLAGFWGQNAVQLALVRDGRVVAEAYPVNPDQYREAYAMDSAAASIESGEAVAEDAAIWPSYQPEVTLASGATVDHLFLWRDVNACWTSSGQMDVQPGTYTLLTMHQLSVGGGEVYYEDGGAIEAPRPLTPDESASGTDAWSGEAPPLTLGDGAGAGSLGDGGGQADIAIAPAPGYYDAIEFQIWTAVGEVRVR